MICPSCRDEYRPGFTRCATCGVDLVESLEAAAPSVRAAATPAAPAATGLLVELTVPFCGYLSLDEARHARDVLRSRGVRSLIVVAEPPEGEPTEEYWLRVAHRDLRATHAILEHPAEEAPPADESFACSACGSMVGAKDRACPGCGLEFEE